MPNRIGRRQRGGVPSGWRSWIRNRQDGGVAGQRAPVFSVDAWHGTISGSSAWFCTLNGVVKLNTTDEQREEDRRGAGLIVRQRLVRQEQRVVGFVTASR